MSQRQELMWLRSIIFQLDSNILSDKIVCMLAPMDIDLLIGERDSPDLIAIPHFAAVVDRKHIGRKWWQEYLEYRILVNDKTPCFVVDDIDQPDDIKVKKVFYTDDADKISRLIQREKKKLTRFNIYYANPYIQRVKMEIAAFWADFV